MALSIRSISVCTADMTFLNPRGTHMNEWNWIQWVPGSRKMRRSKWNRKQCAVTNNSTYDKESWKPLPMKWLLFSLFLTWTIIPPIALQTLNEGRHLWQYRRYVAFKEWRTADNHYNSFFILYSSFSSTWSGADVARTQSWPSFISSHLTHLTSSIMYSHTSLFISLSVCSFYNYYFFSIFFFSLFFFSFSLLHIYRQYRLDA
jgi:hypothetical protein